MVTSTALVESEVSSRAGMKVVLPKANAAGPVSQRRSDPVLTVTKGNELYLGSHKVDPNNLEGEIRKALQEVGSETLLIRGDKSVLLGVRGRHHVGREEGWRQPHRHPDRPQQVAQPCEAVLYMGPVALRKNASPSLARNPAHSCKAAILNGIDKLRGRFRGGTSAAPRFRADGHLAPALQPQSGVIP